MGYNPIYILDCNTMLVSGPDGVGDAEITSSEPSHMVRQTPKTQVRLDAQQQSTSVGYIPGGWIANSSTLKARPWIQVKFLADTS